MKNRAHFMPANMLALPVVVVSWRLWPCVNEFQSCLSLLELSSHGLIKGSVSRQQARIAFPKINVDLRASSMYVKHLRIPKIH